MKYFYLKYGLVFILIALIIFSCEEKPIEPYYGGTVPTLTAIVTDTAYYQGTVTITGQDFDPDPTKNIIRFGFNSMFGYATARAHSGSATSLEFFAPAVAGEYDPYIGTKLSVTTEDARYWSNEIDIVIAPVSSIFADGFSWARGIELDKDGNCYCCDADEGVIYKITPEGDKTVYAEASGPGDIAFDRDGYLYVTTCYDYQLLRIPPGGGEAEVYSEEVGPTISVDWDENGNTYVIGSWWEDGGGIYRVTPEGEVTHFDDIVIDNGRSIRVFDGYVYWSDKGGCCEELGDRNNQIMKAPITADGLGTPETVYSDNEWTGSFIYPAGGIDIDKEGNVYAISSCDQCAYLSRFKPDGTAEVVFTLQPGMGYIAFSGEFLYITTGETILKVFIGIEGAPHY